MGIITSRTHIASQESVQQILEPFIYHDLEYNVVRRSSLHLPEFNFFIHKHSNTYNTDTHSPEWSTTSYYLSKTHSNGNYISFEINEDGSILDTTMITSPEILWNTTGRKIERVANIKYPSFLHFVGQELKLARIMHPDGSIKNINKLFTIPTRVPHTINFSSIHDFSLKKNEMFPILKPNSVVFMDQIPHLFKLGRSSDMIINDGHYFGRFFGISFSVTGQLTFGSTEFSTAFEIGTFKNLFDKTHYFWDVEFIYCGKKFGYLTKSEFLNAVEGIQQITPVIDLPKYVTCCGKLLKDTKLCSDCINK